MKLEALAKLFSEWRAQKAQIREKVPDFLLKKISEATKYYSQREIQSALNISIQPFNRALKKYPPNFIEKNKSAPFQIEASSLPKKNQIDVTEQKTTIVDKSKFEVDADLESKLNHKSEEAAPGNELIFQEISIFKKHKDARKEKDSPHQGDEAGYPHASPFFEIEDPYGYKLRVYTQSKSIQKTLIRTFTLKGNRDDSTNCK